MKHKTHSYFVYHAKQFSVNRFSSVNCTHFSRAPFKYNHWMEWKFSGWKSFQIFLLLFYFIFNLFNVYFPFEYNMLVKRTSLVSYSVLHSSSSSENSWFLSISPKNLYFFCVCSRKFGSKRVGKEYKKGCFRYAILLLELCTHKYVHVLCSDKDYFIQSLSPLSMFHLHSLFRLPSTRTNKMYLWISEEECRSFNIIDSNSKRK